VVAALRKSKVRPLKVAASLRKILGVFLSQSAV